MEEEELIDVPLSDGSRGDHDKKKISGHSEEGDADGTRPAKKTFAGVEAGFENSDAKAALGQVEKEPYSEDSGKRKVSDQEQRRADSEEKLADGDDGNGTPSGNRSPAGDEVRFEKDDAKAAVAQAKTGTSPDSGEKIGGDSDENLAGVDKLRRQEFLGPPPHLPQPAAPPGLLTRDLSMGPDGFRPLDRSQSDASRRLASVSPSLPKRISSLKIPDSVTTLAVLDRTAEEPAEGDDHRPPEIKGRITFFSRSSSRDCGAVRSFLRQLRLPYFEINLDVFPGREKELVERTGTAAVPAIFLNEKYLGDSAALNLLRKSGELEELLREMLGERCPASAPRPPVYGVEDEGGEAVAADAMVGMVRLARQKVPIRDRLVRMSAVKNCFTGSELVEAGTRHLGCGRDKAVEIGKELARKHFIHHVFRENDFEDGKNQFYCFLEHDPVIPNCFNFRLYTNDEEPKPAAEVAQRLTKLMTAILEAYASDDRRHLDYSRINASEELRRYVNLVQDLQRVDIFALSEDERLAFFINLYNAMVVHAIAISGVVDRTAAFFSDFQYLVGGYPYSFHTIKNGILRSNRRQPYTIFKPFSAGDKRLKLAFPKVNPLIHFGLCNGTRSSPTVRFFSAQGVEAELRQAAREFFQDGGVEVDLEKRTVYLTRIIKWYSIDFGHEKDILKWLLDYLDATKAGLLTHLLNDGDPVKIVYQNFDWSLNS